MTDVAPAAPVRCPGHPGWHPQTMPDCAADLRASKTTAYPDHPCPVCGGYRGICARCGGYNGGAAAGPGAGCVCADIAVLARVDAVARQVVEEIAATSNRQLSMWETP